MFGAVKPGFRSLATLKLVMNNTMSAIFKPKRTAAALRGYLATARLSCYHMQPPTPTTRCNCNRNCVCCGTLSASLNMFWRIENSNVRKEDSNCGVDGRTHIWANRRHCQLIDLTAVCSPTQHHQQQQWRNVEKHTNTLGGPEKVRHLVSRLHNFNKHWQIFKKVFVFYWNNKQYVCNTVIIEGPTNLNSVVLLHYLVNISIQKLKKIIR